MDTVFKEGLLYLQAVKFGKKTWRKIWMSLYKPSSTGVGRLELYTVADNIAAVHDNKKTGRPKSQARKVVRLSDCLSVTAAPKESCPTDCEAFYLNTTSATYTLASPTTQDLINALCVLAFQKDPEDADKGAFDRGNGLIMEDNDLYASWESGDTTQPLNVHLVTVRTTEASQRCDLSGDYLVSPEEDALLLLDCNTLDVIYRWPYKMLRKYGQVEGGFSIEAGRRCESGAGKFVFLSKHAQHIFQIISQQCTEKTSTSQQHNNHAAFDQSSAQSPVTADPSCLQDVFSPSTDDKSSQYYCYLSDCFRQLTVDPAHCGLSGEEGGEDDHGCSPDAEDFNYATEERIYYNLPSSVRGQIKDQLQDDSDVLYSEVKKDQASLCQATVQPAYCRALKPRYHLQQRRSDSPLPLCAAQGEVMDNVEEEEGIVSTGQITPSEASASFKHRLAEIISKDLAKFQPPAPPGASPTYPL
ncbi:hypothetical protein NQD34_008160 [Periophthalmus magnuspinnatus]|nr:hypothetical protein NQD34_008160 [Periophthalmus magnuspinnatus]